jgi:hypothetical protein
MRNCNKQNVLQCYAAKEGIMEAIARYEDLEAQIDQNLADFHNIMDNIKEQFTGKMIEAKDEAKVLNRVML